MIRVPELSASVLERIGRMIRAAELHPAAVVNVDLDPGRVAFFRRDVWPVCAPAARRAATEALRAHVRTHGLEGLRDLAEVCGPALARSCAEQVEDGALGANLPETTYRKIHRGQPATRGVATGELVEALRTATAYDPTR